MRLQVKASLTLSLFDPGQALIRVIFFLGVKDFLLEIPRGFTFLYEVTLDSSHVGTDRLLFGRFCAWRGLSLPTPNTESGRRTYLLGTAVGRRLLLLHPGFTNFSLLITGVFKWEHGIVTPPLVHGGGHDPFGSLNHGSLT